MLRKATWRSGYATVCKTVYPGSIPGVASKTPSQRERLPGKGFGAPSAFQGNSLRPTEPKVIRLPPHHNFKKLLLYWHAALNCCYATRYGEIYIIPDYIKPNED